MFPQANTSQAIIDCFLGLMFRLKINLLTGVNINTITHLEDGWQLQDANKNFTCAQLIIASGSSPKSWEMIAGLGHTIVLPVPSLFTFNIKDERISNLPGVAANVSVAVKDTKLTSAGPMLITHWGLSGPAILKLSAWGARILSEKNYLFTITVNWLGNVDGEKVLAGLRAFKEQLAQKIISSKSPFDIPNRLWESLVKAAGITFAIRWADINKQQLQNLANQLTRAEFNVNGKSTYKDEFVTAGGVDLREIDFKTMRSKLFTNLYFAGEVVNIDAVTGGFNFQNAWTGGYLAAKAVAEIL